MSDNRRGAKLRATAARVVDAVVMAGQSLDRALGENLANIPERDHALLRLLSYGALRKHWQLQARIDALLSRPLKPRDSVINALLAVGLYQLDDTRIPDHAAVSQTVEAARQLRRPKLAPLVNAILRRALREGATPGVLPETAQYDHPQWLIDVLRRDWPDDWQAILAANNQRAPMWLRVNPGHATAAEYVAELRAAEIEAALLPAAPYAVRLAEPVPVEALPGFAEGHVSVQDAAAQLAAPWLVEGVSGRILDACAAPGGKSGALLELAGDRIDLTCLDSDAGRLDGVADNLARLRLDATLLLGDASTPGKWWDGQPFDGILLDAPCSASGVIRRHPDIKHLRRPSDVEKLAELQTAILAALWPLLAGGGRLLYVTCSVLAAENERVIGPFLDARPEARELDLLHNYNIRDLMRDKACGLQVLPGTAGLDGFYYACLEKAS